MFINATKIEVDEHLLSTNNVNVLFFSLPTCSRCKFMLGVLEEAIKRMEDIGADQDRVKILKIDCSADMELATEYNVQTVPTIIVKRGEETKEYSGKVDIKQVVADIGALLTK